MSGSCETPNPITIALAPADFLKKGLALNHWTCLEFDASGYDPNIGDASKTGAHFTMTFDGLERTELDALVSGGLSGLLTSSDCGIGWDMSGLDAITTGAGSFLKAVNVYTDVDDTLNKMAAKGAANPMTWWGPLLSQAAALATQNTVPLIGAAAGFITNLIDGGGTSTVPLSYRVNLTGEFRLGTGTLQTGRWLANPGVSVPRNGLRPHPGDAPAIAPEPLGVYSLTREPVIEWYHAPNGPVAQQLGGIRAASRCPSIQRPRQRQPSCRASAAFDRSRPRQRQLQPADPFKDPGAYTGLPEVWMSEAQMNSLKVGVRLQFARTDDPAAPLITFYREYPAVFQPQGVWGDL